MGTQRPANHVGFLSRGPEQTRAFGRQLGRAARSGDLFLLQGSFGAGKTTLVQGIAAALGVHGQVTSPSFTLINEYRGRLPLYHVDLFRLRELDLEMEQAIENCEESGGLTVVEWPDLLPPDLRAGALRMDLEIVGDDERSVVVHAEGTRWAAAALVAMMEGALRAKGRGVQA